MGWAKWRHTLEESKRLATKAVDEYNSSSGHYADFIGTTVRAWLYLFQAEYQRDRRPHWHVDREGKVVMKDGEPKSWELAEFAKDAYAQNDPTRVNLELFILLRNKVEHRYETALKEIAGGRAHALVINYEHRLTEVFGEQHSLARRLRFPLFLESLTAPEHAQAVKSTSAMKAARTMLTKFDAGLDESVLDDNRYDYRIRLVPTTSSKMDADAAYEFVNLDAATPEERETLVAAGKSGKVLTKVRTVSVGAKGTMLPKAVVAAVEKRVPYEFNYAIHTRLWKHFKLHPLRWQAPNGGVTVDKYCVAIEPTRSYVYTAAWVDKIIREVGTAEKFEAFFGYPPKKGKVTSLSSKRSESASAAPPEQQVG